MKIFKVLTLAGVLGASMVLSAAMPTVARAASVESIATIAHGAASVVEVRAQVRAGRVAGGRVAGGRRAVGVRGGGGRMAGVRGRGGHFRGGRGVGAAAGVLGAAAILGGILGAQGPAYVEDDYEEPVYVRPRRYYRPGY